MSADSTIEVLIADNRTFVRIGVQNVLCGTPDIVVTGTAARKAEALTHIGQARPDVVVVGDLDDPGTLIDAVGKAGMQALVLVSGQVRVPGPTAGMLLADASPSELTAAIRMLAAGYSLSPADRPDRGDDPRKMSARELDVLRLLARGYTNVEISRKLTLQESTVKSHVQSLFNKLCVRNRVSAVIYAYEKGLVRTGENLGLVPPRSGIAV